MGSPFIIVAGQSNCFGDTGSRTLPAEYLSQGFSAWKFGCANPTDPRQRRIPWSPLRRTLMYDYQGDNGWGGPDLVIAKVIGDAGHTPTILFHASGATKLATDWNVVKAGLGLYANLIAEVGRAFTSTKNPGGYTSHWLVWIHGESDAMGGNHAAYKTNFDAFWSGLKTALAATNPSMRCVLVKLSSAASGVGVNLGALRTKQDEILAASTDCYLYDATPCELLAGNLHYSEAGRVTLGTGIANAMIAAGSL